MGEAVIIFILIVLNGIFSMAEIALVSARKSKLKSEADKGVKSAKQACKLASDPDKFLSTVQMGMTLVGILTGIFSGHEIAESFAKLLMYLGMAEVAAAVTAKAVIVFLVMYFMILFGELVPKRIALSNPEKSAKLMAKSMLFFEWISAPIVYSLAKSTAFFSRLCGVKDKQRKITEEEILAIIHQGTVEGEVSPAEQNIVDRVFTLGDLNVSNIMTLRDDIVWLDVNMTPAEVRNIIENNIFAQYPVVDGDLDHIEGVLSIKDYVVHIGALKDCGNNGDNVLNIRNMMSDPVYFHENMTVYNVLDHMKAKKVNRALVCDEFGTLSGIISLNDILDALVGNNSNTHVKEPDIIPSKNSEGWIVDGQCSIYDFLSYFDLDEIMEDYDFSTVGGLILEILQHVPSTGEKAEWKAFKFKVARMDGARIDKIFVNYTVPPVVAATEEQINEKEKTQDEKEK